MATLQLAENYALDKQSLLEATALLEDVAVEHVTDKMAISTLEFLIEMYLYPVVKHGANYAVRGKEATTVRDDYDYVKDMATYYANKKAREVWESWL